MPLQTSRRVLQLERKLSEKRRKLMELASQCANEVTEHDWDSIIKLTKSKIDPRKKPLNLTQFRLTTQH